MKRKSVTSAARRSIATIDLFGPALTGSSVAVIGAGIGGLAAAVAMAKAGADVTVFEQAEALREVGAGLQVTPNGARVIRALCGSGALRDCSLQAEAVEPMDALTGRSIARFPLPQSDAGYHLLARPDLLDLLATAARSVGVELRTGAGAFAGQDGTVQSGGKDERFDWIIGADGLHSRVRRVVDPEAADGAFTGQVAWRAVVKDAGHPVAPRIWMAPGRHVVTYPLPDGRLNVVAVEERAAWASEGWSHPDDPDRLRAAFAGLAPDLGEIFGRVEHTHIWGLFRHPVADHWGRGAIAILGDAAHPTLPFLAQGANLALEDAMILSRCLSMFPAEHALTRYQNVRRRRVVRAIDAANSNARNYHLRGVPRRVAHLGLSAMARLAPKAFIARYDWLYDYDAVTASLD